VKECCFGATNWQKFNMFEGYSLMANYWTGAAGNNDWSDTANWSDGILPQSEVCQEANISGTSDNPAFVVDSTANYNQIHSLTIGDDATVEVTALPNSPGNVFATASMQIFQTGNLIINTPGHVELGGPNVISGTLSILNNNGNVILDNSRLNGSGTINLINSTLGSAQYPVSVADSMTINIEAGSTLYAGFYASGATVNFSPTGANNTLFLTGAEKNVTTTFNNVSSNTVFGIEPSAPSAPVSAQYVVNSAGTGGELVVTMQDGQTLTLGAVNFAHGFHPGTPSVTALPGGGWIITDTNSGNPNVCFLDGTLIRTDRGDVAVETLRVGDMVEVVGESVSHRAVTWVGSQDFRADTALADADAGYAVCIRAHAIGANQPARDLYVTPEHCILVDGGLIPARMLVNGATIFYDRSQVSYRFHHVETAQHSVIVAENLATESYLDTGNRHTFASDVTPIFTAAKSWDEAAVPLMVARAVVEPIHARLVARAESLGHVVPGSVATTDDAELTLTTHAGTVLRKLREANGYTIFALPEGVESVRIVSRSGKPADVVGPFVDDRRELGVLVGSVMLWDSNDTRAVTSHLTDASASGWHGVEATDMRWTDGMATLSLGARQPNSAGLLGLKIVSAGPYAVVETAELRKSA